MVAAFTRVSETCPLLAARRNCLFAMEYSLVAELLKYLPAMQETTCNRGDPVLILGWGRFPGEGNSNPLQYSFLGNPMDRGAWWATVLGFTESDMT